MKKFIALFLVLCLFGTVAETAYAGSRHRSRTHEHNVDDGDAPLGVGANVLIHEAESVDLVGEYRYDAANDVHAAFAVVQTKKSLVDYIRDFLGNDGE
jgi:hypothetical protein